MDMVGMVSQYMGYQNAQLRAEVGVKVFKEALDFNNQLMETLIEKMAGVGMAQNLNDNPTNTAVFLNIRV